MFVTNNHFKELIHQWKNFSKNNSEVPKDLVDDFLREIKVSNLLLLIKMDESLTNYSHITTDDGLKLIPLYTDNEELEGHDEECIPIGHEIGFYISLVENSGFDGIVINPKSDGLLIDKCLLSRITPYARKPTDKRFTGSELKKIAFDAKNSDLLEFISDEDNFNNYDELMELFADSTLLSVVFSLHDLGEIANDGIISKEDTIGFGITKVDRGDEDYLVLFTSIDPIIKTLDRSEDYHYIQVVNLYELIKFTLVNDMGGIILNPALEEYVIPRNVLIDIMEKKLVQEQKYPNSFDYAFEF